MTGDGRYIAAMWTAMTRPEAAVVCPCSCMWTGVMVITATITSWVSTITVAPVTTVGAPLPPGASSPDGAVRREVDAVCRSPVSRSPVSRTPVSRSAASATDRASSRGSGRRVSVSTAAARA